MAQQLRSSLAVAGDEDAGSVESVFEQARQVAAEAEVVLVDEALRSGSLSIDL